MLSPLTFCPLLRGRTGTGETTDNLFICCDNFYCRICWSPHRKPAGSDVTRRHFYRIISAGERIFERGVAPARNPEFNSLA